MIARALDDDSYVASIDLSAAFNVVNMGLLIKRFRILGLPNDVITLIEIWLNERYFYVGIGNVNSTVKLTWYGIIQGCLYGQRHKNRLYMSAH